MNSFILTVSFFYAYMIRKKIIKIIYKGAMKKQQNKGGSAPPASARLPLNQIILGDSVKVASTLPSQSVDMIFADPPYNLQLGGDLHRPDNSKVEAVNDDWDKFDNFQAYDKFSEKWLKEMHRLLKPNGSIWVIGSYHNIYRLGRILQDLGFWILNDILWIKHNPMPNFKGTRFTNAHETLLWCSKSKDAKYTFHYEAMKMLNEDVQMRSDWYFPICSGGERLRDDRGGKLHPTQKPEALLNRILLSTTNKGDIVLDPFSGTGTTAAVAKKLRRQFIGIEQDEEYHALSNYRLKNITDEQILSDGDVATIPAKRKERRIPFGQLIENGLLSPGQILTSPCEKYNARIRADGSLVVKNVPKNTSTARKIDISTSHLKHSHTENKFIEGSIHQVGAELQGAPSCNGWTYWHVHADKENKASNKNKKHPPKILLDDLRKIYRESITHPSPH